MAKINVVTDHFKNQFSLTVKSEIMQLYPEPLLLYGLPKTILKSVDSISFIGRDTSSDVL